MLLKCYVWRFQCGTAVTWALCSLLRPHCRDVWCDKHFSLVLYCFKILIIISSPLPPVFNLEPEDQLWSFWSCCLVLSKPFLTTWPLTPCHRTRSTCSWWAVGILVDAYLWKHTPSQTHIRDMQHMPQDSVPVNNMWSSNLCKCLLQYPLLFKSWDRGKIRLTNGETVETGSVVRRVKFQFGFQKKTSGS